MSQYQSLYNYFGKTAIKNFWFNSAWRILAMSEQFDWEDVKKLCCAGLVKDKECKTRVWAQPIFQSLTQATQFELFKLSVER